MFLEQLLVPWLTTFRLRQLEWLVECPMKSLYMFGPGKLAPGDRRGLNALLTLLFLKLRELGKLV